MPHTASSRAQHVERVAAGDRSSPSTPSTSAVPASHTCSRRPRAQRRDGRFAPRRRRPCRTSTGRRPPCRHRVSRDSSGRRADDEPAIPPAWKRFVREGDAARCARRPARARPGTRSDAGRGASTRSRSASNSAARSARGAQRPAGRRGRRGVARHRRLVGERELADPGDRRAPVRDVARPARPRVAAISGRRSPRRRARRAHRRPARSR